MRNEDEIKQIEKQTRALEELVVAYHMPKTTGSLQLLKEQLKSIVACGPGSIDDYTWPFILAAKKTVRQPGRTEALQAFLEAGMDPLARSRDGLTALHECSVDVVRILLKAAGARFDANMLDDDGNTPLLSAVMGLNHAMMEMRHLHSDKPHPILEKIRLLLDHGADPNIKDGMWEAPLLTVINMLAQKSRSSSDMDGDDGCDYLLACAASLLLQHGANPNEPGIQGQTALGVLCSQSSPDRVVCRMMKDLLMAGAHIIPDTGQIQSIARMAVAHDDAQLLGLLIGKGFCPQSPRASTLFTSAVHCQSHQCLILMMEHGWDPMSKDARGRVALQSYAKPETAALIRSLASAMQAREAVREIAKADASHMERFKAPKLPCKIH